MLSGYLLRFFKNGFKVLTFAISWALATCFSKKQETIFIFFLASIILNNIILHIYTKTKFHGFICKKSNSICVKDKIYSIFIGKPFKQHQFIIFQKAKQHPRQNLRKQSFICNESTSRSCHIEVPQ